MKSELEISNICCSALKEILHHFDWFNYTLEDGKKVYCMPTLELYKGDVSFRVNNCPVCGESIRDIELKE